MSLLECSHRRIHSFNDSENTYASYRRECIINFVRGGTGTHMHHMDVNDVLNAWRLNFYILVASLTIRTIRTTLYVQVTAAYFHPTV
jgi:hypothetical protein